MPSSDRSVELTTLIPPFRRNAYADTFRMADTQLFMQCSRQCVRQRKGIGAQSQMGAAGLTTGFSKLALSEMRKHGLKDRRIASAAALWLTVLLGYGIAPVIARAGQAATRSGAAREQAQHGLPAPASPQSAVIPASGSGDSLDFLGSYGAAAAIESSETSHTSARPPAPTASQQMSRFSRSLLPPPWPEDLLWPTSVVARCDDTRGRDAELADRLMRERRFDSAAGLYAAIAASGRCPAAAWNRRVAKAYALHPAESFESVSAPSSGAARDLARLEALLLGAPRKIQERSRGQSNQRSAIWLDGLAAAETGDYPKAHSLLAGLARTHPSSVYVWLALGITDLSRAREESRRLSFLAPGSMWDERLKRLGAESSLDTVAAKGRRETNSAGAGACGLRSAQIGGAAAAGEDPARSSDAEARRLYEAACGSSENAHGEFGHARALPGGAERLKTIEALAAEERHDDAAAERDYRAGLVLEPKDSALLAGLGSFYRSRGRWQEARIELEKAHAADPDDPYTLFELGDTLLELGQPAAARPLLNRALDLDPALLLARWSRARAAAALGDNGAAVTDYIAAAPVDSSGELQWQLARLYRRMGNDAAAKIAMKRSDDQRRHAQAK
jgi:tetratricopeptide (TPR) repeat protein